jgi:hypothetical protein
MVLNAETESNPWHSVHGGSTLTAEEATCSVTSLAA